MPSTCRDTVTAGCVVLLLFLGSIFIGVICLFGFVWFWIYVPELWPILITPSMLITNAWLGYLMVFGGCLFNVILTVACARMIVIEGPNHIIREWLDWLATEYRYCRHGALYVDPDQIVVRHQQPDNEASSSRRSTHPSASSVSTPRRTSISSIAYLSSRSVSSSSTSSISNQAQIFMYGFTYPEDETKEQLVDI